jgi:hypothetical protein
MENGRRPATGSAEIREMRLHAYQEEDNGCVSESMNNEVKDGFNYQNIVRGSLNLPRDVIYQLHVDTYGCRFLIIMYHCQRSSHFGLFHGITCLTTLFLPMIRINWIDCNYRALEPMIKGLIL